MNPLKIVWTVALALMLTGLVNADVSDLDLPVVDPRLQIVDTTGKGRVDPVAPTPLPNVEDPRDIPLPSIYGEEIPVESDSLYYVIDISGSMDADEQPYITVDGNKAVGKRIDRAKAELTRSIYGLSENFSFNVIAFDCSMFMWRQQLQKATAENKQLAVSWVMALVPTGSTGTGPAVSLALADKINRTVVLITDGAPNCGVPAFSSFYTTGSYDPFVTAHQHRIMIQNQNTSHARINVFGIAASGIYRSFCQNVASDSGGSYIDVP